MICFSIWCTTLHGYYFVSFSGPVSTTPTKPDEGFDALPIIIAVVVFVCLIAVFVVVICILRKRRNNKKLEASKEQFDRTIMSEHNDGSFQFENRLANSVPTPEVQRVSYQHRGEDHFASISTAYRNPGYATSIDAVSRNEPQEQNRPDVGNNTHYDYPITRGRTEDPHTYQSLKRQNDENEASYLEPTGLKLQHSNQNEISDSANGHTALASHGELASPTDDKHEPHFLQVADVNVDVDTN